MGLLFVPAAERRECILSLRQQTKSQGIAPHRGLGGCGAFFVAQGTLATKGDSEQSESIDDAAHRISAHPEIVAVLGKNGFSPKEFVVTEMTLVMAGFVEASAKQSGADVAKLTKEAHVNPANVAFVTEHEAEIEALQKKSNEAKRETSPNETGPVEP